MSMTVTDLFQLMQGDFAGTGYVSVGTAKHPNLIVIYFGMKNQPTRKEAEALANSLVGNKALEACA